jgi:sulfite reductase (ferredoxin)
VGKPSRLEGTKHDSGYLAGTLAEELAGDGPDFSGDAAQVLKFHGIYQQDDRDVRRERAKQGLGRDYVCMVRTSLPGGVLTPGQYLALDGLADRVADGTLRVTTRQGIQYHFTRKGDLPGLIRALNQNLVTTLAACGDVVRNVMACPAPLADRPAVPGGDLQRYARELSQAVKPRTDSYWQLWVDGERAVTAAPPPEPDGEVEPLYGPTYLPRKFKIGFAFPGDNCIDVYSHDIGIVPRIGEDGRVEAFTLLVGGGLGMTHNKPATFPRLADPLATIAPDELIEVVTTIITVQRDHGDRSDRKHARMKYLVDEWGVERFRGEVERRLGRGLAPPDLELLDWEDTDDHLGWHPEVDGRWFLGVRVEHGRIKDDEDAGVHLRSALRGVVERFAGEVRLTPRQDVLLCGIADEDRGAVDAALQSHGVPPVEQLAPVARHALACPALPTCGLALTEAERVMPDLVGRLAGELEAAGLAGDAVHVRMTGCPNGCARPYSTEIGVVGRGNGFYNLYLGGRADGSRLNELFAERVALDDVVPALLPVVHRYRDERRGDEDFGDFCHRVGVAGLRA